MDIGLFYTDEPVHLFITCHRFESGERYNATVKIVIGLQNQDYDEGTEYSMTQVTDETGLYHKEFSAGALSEGLYWGIVNSVIDTVNVRQHYHFRILKRPIWLLGVF